MGQGTVFLIEDDDDLRETVAARLEAEGYLVLPGRNGREALSRMRGMQPPRVAVVDLEMPDMNGEGLIGAMHADPKLRAIPVIVTSGTSRESIEGARCLLRKPYDMQTLLAAIHDGILSDPVS